ncbi:hypothetical protein AAT19DRAFT_11015 [Rhodotorula toruloides]|uniref:Uncharacterized protein n=1 Tax=Rhodotorula toruloides TaxID=5286 RepID=A0A2S9ZYK8_RHOTO|nr:hypothetical protein AAT19DRAFT_11015 [Rhodotorula toruloides]
MPVALPLELQLHILELALPPIILSRLDERVRLCKTFSLVHRTWTRVAQRELHEHTVLRVGEDEQSVGDSLCRLQLARQGGWAVKRIYLDLGDATRAQEHEMGDSLLKDELSTTVEELWLRLGEEGVFTLGPNCIGACISGTTSTTPNRKLSGTSTRALRSSRCAAFESPTTCRLCRSFTRC